MYKIIWATRFLVSHVNIISEFDSNHSAPLSALIPWTQCSGHYFNVPFSHYTHISSRTHSAQVTSAGLNSIYNPLPSILLIYLFIHLPTSILSYPPSITAETTLIHLPSLTPFGEKSSIYLVSPCFAITSLRNPSFCLSIHPSIHLPLRCTLLLLACSLSSVWQCCRLSPIIPAKVVPTSIHLTQPHTISLDVIWHNIMSSMTRMDCHTLYMHIHFLYMHHLLMIHWYLKVQDVKKYIINRG